MRDRRVRDHARRVLADALACEADHRQEVVAQGAHAFYANLIASTDEYVADVMNALARRGLIDNTVIIKTGDHGEMGMTHGGERTPA